MTEGAIDDALRHSITKMSQLHFVATDEYRNRVIQLGEHPDRVSVVGGLGIDCIKRLELMTKTDLEESLGLKFKKRNLLITFHPVTLEKTCGSAQLDELFKALNELDDTLLIFTMPNADSEGRKLTSMISAFVAGNENARSFASMGQLRYLSCMQYVDGVVGNSSSGILEAPTFKVGTIDIGNRQKGRVKADSVIECGTSSNEIVAAIKTLYSKSFRAKLSNTTNPYGDGGAAHKIVNSIKNVSMDALTKKAFYDLPIANAL